VTFTAGVPTVLGLLGILERLNKPSLGGLGHLVAQGDVVGALAAPQAMIEAFEKKHKLRVITPGHDGDDASGHWLSRLKPTCTGRPDAERFRARQQAAGPFVETRVIGSRGRRHGTARRWGSCRSRPVDSPELLPEPAEADKFTMDGWFRTGTS